VISAIYASSLALLFSWLSLRVIGLRRQHRIRYGDGGNQVLVIARSAQSNAAQYIPPGLILLFALEVNNAPVALIHAAGAALLSGRLLHAFGILNERLNLRVLGMQLTLGTIIGLALMNLVYAPYTRLFSD
jgi:uncharacterized membrane protein YecN with MAPEG domain